MLFLGQFSTTGSSAAKAILDNEITTIIKKSKYLRFTTQWAPFLMLQTTFEPCNLTTFQNQQKIMITLFNYTYGFVVDNINMDEYGSIGFGPVSSSSSFFSSLALPSFPLLKKKQIQKTNCILNPLESRPTISDWLNERNQLTNFASDLED